MSKQTEEKTFELLPHQKEIAKCNGELALFVNKGRAYIAMCVPKSMLGGEDPSTRAAVLKQLKSE